ncbi:hypothetical protein EVA_15695 [gut metagenome]|uniref:Uncharacterized protein n=1 Tax=gut metagenome TaxID=749906 RepID=J9FP13_9ZZZZ
MTSHRRRKRSWTTCASCPSRSPQTEKAITRGRALPQKNFMT